MVSWTNAGNEALISGYANVAAATAVVDWQLEQQSHHHHNRRDVWSVFRSGWIHLLATRESLS